MAEEDDARDVVFELRQRLYELIEHFRADMNRLNVAQDQILDRRAWDERVRADAEALTGGGPLGPPPAALAPVDALRALETFDLAASRLAPRASLLTRPQLFGAGERARYVVPRVRASRPLSGRQAGHLSTHLRRHVLVPPRITVPGGATFTVRFEPLRRGAARAQAISARRALVVGNTAFEDRAAIDWSPVDGRAVTVATADERAANLVSALNAAAAAGVDIVVAPELTLPPAQRDAVLRALRDSAHPARLVMAVLGTFHESRSDRGHGARTFNVAQLVDGFGNRLLEHRKLVRFGDLDVPDLPPEKIHVGDEIRVLLTPFGTVAVAICKDFCDDRFGVVWQEIQPDLLLVPAYGRGGSAHVRAAREVARTSGTVTVVAHEALHSVPDQDESFVHDALQPREIRGHRRAPEFASHNIPLILVSHELDPEDPSN